jgi:hypothetical protein
LSPGQQGLIFFAPIIIIVALGIIDHEFVFLHLLLLPLPQIESPFFWVHSFPESQQPKLRTTFFHVINNSYFGCCRRRRRSWRSLQNSGTIHCRAGVGGDEIVEKPGKSCLCAVGGPSWLGGDLQIIILGVVVNLGLVGDWFQVVVTVSAVVRWVSVSFWGWPVLVRLGFV